MQFQQCNCFHVDGGVIVMLLWNAAAFSSLPKREEVSLGCEGQRLDKGGLCSIFPPFSSQ